MKVINYKLFCVVFVSVNAYAGIDKVYDPYVYQGELEIEARGIHQFDDADAHKVKLGVGYGVNAAWFVEGYAIVEQETGNSAKVEAVELENKFQLTEQGQYWVDIGLLTELERVVDEDVWEFKVGPLFQKQIKDWVATANFFLEKKFGSDTTESEVEFLGAVQLKYRLSPSLEPAVEYYGDEETHAIGPVLLGKNRWGKIPVKWELGVLKGLNDDASDINFRWLLELEFY
jgi:hypothetical protein